MHKHASKKPVVKKATAHTQPASPATKAALEGEGSYRAARAYDKEARAFVRSGQVGPAASEAKRAVESDKGELSAAEVAGKRGPKP